MRRDGKAISPPTSRKSSRIEQKSKMNHFWSQRPVSLIIRNVLVSFPFFPLFSSFPISVTLHLSRLSRLTFFLRHILIVPALSLIFISISLSSLRFYLSSYNAPFAVQPFHTHLPSSCFVVFSLSLSLSLPLSFHPFSPPTTPNPLSLSFSHHFKHGLIPRTPLSLRLQTEASPSLLLSRVERHNQLRNAFTSGERLINEEEMEREIRLLFRYIIHITRELRKIE